MFIFILSALVVCIYLFYFGQEYNNKKGDYACITLPEREEQHKKRTTDSTKALKGLATHIPFAQDYYWSYWIFGTIASIVYWVVIFAYFIAIVHSKPSESPAYLWLVLFFALLIEWLHIPLVLGLFYGNIIKNRFQLEYILGSINTGAKWVICFAIVGGTINSGGVGESSL
jgi:hypothetical protein